MIELKFNPFPTLFTERLILKKIEKSDAQDMYIMRSDKEIMNYIPRPIATTIADAEHLIETMHAGIENKTSINWGICKKADNKLVGVVGFVRMNIENYRAEVGYLLHKDLQGHGFMHEALQPIIKYGFEQMQLHTIEAVIDPQNVASEKLLRKNNFVKEAHFRENVFYKGEFLDSVHYTLFN